MRKVLYLTDAHIPNVDDRAMGAMLDHALPQEITTVIMGGDVVDLYHCSTFSKDPTAPSMKQECEGMHEFLELLDVYFPSVVERYYIVGNHDRRLERYIQQNAPAIADLGKLTIPDLYGLTKFKYQYIDNIKLMEAGQRPFSIGNLFYFHGDEFRLSNGVINVAAVALRRARENCIFGHFHTTQEASETSVAGSVKAAWSVGHLGPNSPGYRPINNWNHGFAIVNHWDDDYFTVNNMRIIDGRVV